GGAWRRCTNRGGPTGDAGCPTASDAARAGGGRRWDGRGWAARGRLGGHPAPTPPAGRGPAGGGGDGTGLVAMSVASLAPRAAFQAELSAVRQRIWLERVGVVVTRGLMLGFFLTLVVAIVAWALRFPMQPLWYAAPLLVPLAFALIVAAFRYPSAI